MSEAYSYALFPSGKMFRPLLMASSYQDHHGQAEVQLRNPYSDLSKLCSSVEIHHAYTLIHDDLPSMDDDDMRRGRPSLHKAFGEWQAILAGDGLLNLSYALLSELDSEHSNRLRKFYSWALGPRGLIHGQVLDLSQTMENSFENLLETHKLKTARLIQVSLLSGLLAQSEKEVIWDKSTKSSAYQLFKLGHSLGIVFQLLDDLTELDGPLSEHELSINPWPKYFDLTKKTLLKELNVISHFQNTHSKNALNQVYNDYLKKIEDLIIKNEKSIIDHLGKESKENLIHPIMSFFH